MVAYLGFHSACENTRYEGMGMRLPTPRGRLWRRMEELFAAVQLLFPWMRSISTPLCSLVATPLVEGLEKLISVLAQHTKIT